ncbi:hypothetical protein ACFC0S_03095 [Streptomyces sp. NPDC056084]|uniref:hypothetical protein n=1 Tax=unclassified Streptomyces TaxID=2593676 RepID=UPI0035D96796
MPRYMGHGQNVVYRAVVEHRYPQDADRTASNKTTTYGPYATSGAAKAVIRRENEANYVRLVTGRDAPEVRGRIEHGLVVWSLLEEVAPE